MLFDKLRTGNDAATIVDPASIAAPKSPVLTSERKKFLGWVAAPTAVAALYFGLIATPVYRSTTTLMVSNPSKETGGMSAFLSGGTGDSMSGAFIVKDFTQSWGEFKSLDTRIGLAKLWGSGDVISSYIRVLTSDIALFHYFQSHVVTKIDNRSGIVSLETYAYSSRAAYDLSGQILADTEQRINQINHQKDVDLVRTATDQLAQAKALVAADNADMAAFRKRTGYYKPDLDYSAALQTQSNLTGSMAKAQADYSGVTGATPNSPVVGALKDEIASYREGSQSLVRTRSAINRVSREYDALESKRALDVSMMEKAGAVVQETVLKSSADHYYLNVISDPSQPGSAEYPLALYWVLGVFGITYAFYKTVIR